MLGVLVIGDVEVIEATKVEEEVEEVVWLVVNDVEEVEITEDEVEVEVLVVEMGPGKVKPFVANTVGGYLPSSH